MIVMIRIYEILFWGSILWHIYDIAEIHRKITNDDDVKPEDYLDKEHIHFREFYKL